MLLHGTMISKVGLLMCCSKLEFLVEKGLASVHVQWSTSIYECSGRETPDTFLSSIEDTVNPYKSSSKESNCLLCSFFTFCTSHGILIDDHEWTFCTSTAAHQDVELSLLTFLCIPSSLNAWMPPQYVLTFFCGVLWGGYTCVAGVFLMVRSFGSS